MMTVTVGLAFLAGLVSFLSPCVFSLVPVYVGYLGGRTLNALSDAHEVNQWETFRHGVAFVFGFSVVFVVLGVAVSSLGKWPRARTARRSFESSASMALVV